MRINNPKNMSNEELLSKIYVDSNVFQGDGTKNNVLKLKQDISFDSTPVAIEDYTAFEVFAHNYDIPVGYCVQLEGNVTNAISASMTHVMQIRTAFNNPTQTDIIVDWGDGKQMPLKDCQASDEIQDELTQFKISSAAEGDLTIDLQHTYENNGKYIVKIYGKNYYNIMIPNGDTDNSLICRVLDNDLPIASHITNVSSFSRNSIRLLKVRLPEYFDVSNWINVVSLFQNCKNLLSLTGFSRKFVGLHSLQYFMAGTTSLQECDLTIPPILFRDGKAFYNFASNSNFVDLDQLFSNGALDGTTNISMAQAFMNAIFKEGTVIPADKLWNDKTKIWQDTTKAFRGCAAEIRAQVPTSWGGSNTNLENALAITDEMKEDYTAFEVFAHDYEIPSGEVNDDLGGMVNNVISAQMKHYFYIMSYQDQPNQNVIIDWGDGSVVKLSSATPTASENEFSYLLKHTYATNGKYIVKIYGNTYFSIKHSTGASIPNIVCRVLDKDLPVASHITNFKEFCCQCKHLLNVNVINNKNFNLNYANITSMFKDCLNLLEAKGFIVTNKTGVEYTGLFANCTSLTYTDFKLINSKESYADVFNNCLKLGADINDLLKGFNPDKNSSINVNNLFANCALLSGVVPADKLWNDKSITWLNNERCFTECSEQIRSQVPVSWGGTNQNIDIELSLSDQMKSDYTAFEVFAHDYDISKGTFVEQLGGEIRYSTLTAQMTHQFYIYSYQSPEQQNIIIDWGDGDITCLKDVVNVNSSNNWIESNCYWFVDNSYYRYNLSHEYKVNGKYIVRIYGSTYYSFLLANTTAPVNANIPNILCRIFDTDLPVFSKLKNFSSTCRCSKHLLYVNANNCKHFSDNWENIYSLFGGCVNLISAFGLNNHLKLDAVYDSVFRNCNSLTDTDFILTPTSNSVSGCFYKCSKLAKNIQDILKYFRPLNNSTISMEGTFTSCSSLTGTVPADKLWNTNVDVIWTDTETTFTGCKKLVDMVPVSWGGNVENSTLIVPTQKEKIVHLQSRVDQNFQLINNKQEIITGIHGDFVIINAEGKAEATQVTLPSTSLFVNHVDNLDNPVEEQLNKIVIYTGESTNDINGYIKGHIYQCSSYLDAGLSSLEFLNGFYILGGTYNNQSYYVKEFDGSKYYIYWAGDELNFWVLTRDLLGDITDKQDSVLFISNTGLDSLTDVWRDDDVNYSNNQGELPPRMELVFNWNDITSCANLESSVSQMEQRLSTLEAVAARLANI